MYVVAKLMIENALDGLQKFVHLKQTGIVLLYNKCVITVKNTR